MTELARAEKIALIDKYLVDKDIDDDKFEGSLIKALVATWECLPDAVIDNLYVDAFNVRKHGDWR
tara:strand:- start:286 stop:480 length:195 start_codon:yes stop_codon:yes gene_type:complete